MKKNINTSNLRKSYIVSQSRIECIYVCLVANIRLEWRENQKASISSE
jgi:hypothetical protein